MTVMVRALHMIKVENEGLFQLLSL